MPQENGEKQVAKTGVRTYDPGAKWLPYGVSAIHVVLLAFFGWIVAQTSGSDGNVYIPLISFPISVIAVHCFCFGVIGGTLCASRWVILAMGRQIYDKNRLLWQLMIPVHGGFLAIFVLIAVKAGLMSMTGANQAGTVGDPNRYQWLILSLAFLSGFASRVLIERIEGMARALFGSEPEKESSIRKQPQEPSSASESSR